MLAEGAGSAAEINLRAGDIANMGFARAAIARSCSSPTSTAAEFSLRLLGTKAALAPDDAATIVGFIVNKFRGDASLFDDGMKTIAEATGWRAFGLAPFFPDAARLPAEDAFGLPTSSRARERRRSRSPRRCSRGSRISTTSILSRWSPT